MTTAFATVTISGRDFWLPWTPRPPAPCSATPERSPAGEAPGVAP